MQGPCQALPDLPQLLKHAGLNWRWALPDDEVFIAHSWLASGRKPFLAGDTTPFPHLVRAVQEARRNGHDVFLERLYEREQRWIIRRALIERSPLVVFDVETPSFIAAWAHPRYVYVKQDFRGMGIGTTLFEAIGPRRLAQLG
jgi:GNAT superfamily N-acetyltransferase